MRTYTPKSSETTRTWHIFDAQGQVLGRLATQISVILMGKHKPSFARYLDLGDHVVVINASQVAVTGRKADHKLYHSHSGYPGGMKVTTYHQMMEKDPTRIISSAVSGMLPDNKLKPKMLQHLHIYPGSEHPYVKQFSN